MKTTTIILKIKEDLEKPPLSYLLWNPKIYFDSLRKYKETKFERTKMYKDLITGAQIQVYRKVIRNLRANIQSNQLNNKSDLNSELTDDINRLNKLIDEMVEKLK